MEIKSLAEFTKRLSDASKQLTIDKKILQDKRIQITNVLTSEEINYPLQGNKYNNFFKNKIPAHEGVIYDHCCDRTRPPTNRLDKKIPEQIILDNDGNLDNDNKTLKNVICSRFINDGTEEWYSIDKGNGINVCIRSPKEILLKTDEILHEYNENGKRYINDLYLDCINSGILDQSRCGCITSGNLTDLSKRRNTMIIELDGKVNHANNIIRNYNEQLDYISKNIIKDYENSSRNNWDFLREHARCHRLKPNRGCVVWDKDCRERETEDRHNKGYCEKYLENYNKSEQFANYNEWLLKHNKIIQNLKLQVIPNLGKPPDDNSRQSCCSNVNIVAGYSSNNVQSCSMIEVKNVKEDLTKQLTELTMQEQEKQERDKKERDNKEKETQEEEKKEREKQEQKKEQDKKEREKQEQKKEQEKQEPEKQEQEKQNFRLYIILGVFVVLILIGLFFIFK